MRNSPHDFSSAGIINPTGEICRVCHVPHDHQRSLYTNGLLWNHQVSSATYTMYGSAWSSTIEGVQSAHPDGTAKLCLGCHDGTVGIDSLDKYAGGVFHIYDFDDGIYQISEFRDGANVDLRGTHPISIRFPAGQTGDGKNFTDPASATWANGDTVASTLDNGKLQCSTCHDVHDQDSVPLSNLLRAAQRAAVGGTPSGLCFTCHVK